jgi:hypothetical protein
MTTNKKNPIAAQGVVPRNTTTTRQSPFRFNSFLLGRTALVSDTTNVRTSARLSVPGKALAVCGRFEKHRVFDVLVALALLRTRTRQRHAFSALRAREL